MTTEAVCVVVFIASYCIEGNTNAHLGINSK